MRKKRYRTLGSILFDSTYKVLRSGATVVFLVTLFSSGAKSQCNAKFDFELTSCKGVQINYLTGANDVDNEFEVDWGDGSANTTTNGPVTSFTHTYSKRKTYNVEIVKTHKTSSCTSTVKLTIQLPPKPRFEYDSVHICVGETYLFPLFKDSSKNLTNIDTVTMDFGDGSPEAKGATLTSFSHLYSDTGTYQCTTTIRQALTSVKNKKNQKYCVDRYHPEPIIFVHDTPKAEFIAPDTVCVGQKVYFSDTSTISDKPFQDAIERYEWDFGDNNTTTNTTGDAQHTYTKDDTYFVTLKVTTDTLRASCPSIYRKKIVVCPKPLIQFTSQKQCINDSIKFLNQSVNNSCCGNVKYYQWDFGDGKKSKQIKKVKSIKHRYDAVGSYKVYLHAYMSRRGYIVSDSSIIEIFEKPDAHVSLANTCNEERVLFTDSSSITTNSLDSIYWSFGDGNTLDTLYSNQLSHKYSANSDGNKTITAIVVTDKSCRDTFEGSLTIFPTPKVSFNFNNTCLNKPAKFVNTTSISSPSKIASSRFRFGDGRASTKSQPELKYKKKGTFTVWLNAFSDKGCKDSVDDIIIIHPLPDVDFTNDTAACTGKDVDFINTSTVTTTATWRWDFDGADSSDVKSPKQAFKSKGIKQVTLEATNSFGCKEDTNHVIEIIGTANPNFFISADTACTPATIAFTKADTSEYETYEWEVDGVLASTYGKLGDQKFEANGNTDEQYSVKLKATNLCGFKSESKNITIIPKPIAKFTPFGSNISCTPSKFTFENNSAGLADSFFWYLESSKPPIITTGTGQKVDYTFIYKKNSPNSKKFTVKLVAKNECDEDEETYDLTVFSKDVNALFELVDSNDLYGCLPHTVELKDNSVNSKAALYDMGDKTKITVAVLGDTNTHTYTTAGSYVIKQMVSGCGQDTVEQNDTVIVYDLPVAEIIDLPSIYCSRSPLTLSAAGSDLSKTWLIDTDPDFSLPDRYVANSPTVSLRSIGGDTTKYYIKLLVSKHEKTGPVCDNESLDSILIVPEPIPIVSSLKEEGCHPIKISVTNKSLNAGSWLWQLNKYNRKDNKFETEAQSSLSKTFQYSFNNRGTEVDRYRLLLTIDNNTCTDTVSTLVRVFPLPKSEFSFELLDSNVENCNSSNTMGVKFTNTSTSASEYSWDFGDGSNSINPEPEHTYTLDKTKLQEKFTVVLTAISKFKCQTQSDDTVKILSQPQINIDTNIRDVCQGDEILLTSNTIEPRAVYEWRFPNKTPITGDSIYTSFSTQLKKGSVESEIIGLQLHVAFPNGCEDSLDVKEFIKLYHRSQPDFWFTHEDTLVDDCYPDGRKKMVFNATASINASSYHWYYGDGTNEEGTAEQRHTFRLPTSSIHDSFKVSLISENKAGCPDTLSQYVEVLQKPEVGFPQKSIQICENDSFTYTPNVVEAMATYYWELGNGLSDTGDVFKNKLVIPNRDNSKFREYYDFKLLATYPNGCRDSLEFTNHIEAHLLPEAHFWFTHEDTLIDDCYPEGKKRILFNTDSTVNAKEYAWDFGNGNTSTITHPTQNFKLPKKVSHDSFLVSLMIENRLGCTDTALHYVDVREKPEAKFPKTPIVICENDSITLQPNVTHPEATYTWVLSNGMTLVGDSLRIPIPINNKQPANEKEVYNIKLIADFPSGCKDSILRDSVLPVFYLPETHFWFAPVNPQADDCYTDGIKEIKFHSDSSTNSRTFLWDFGNGKTSTDTNPSPVFKLGNKITYDSFWVNLVTENKLGCKDSMSRYVFVKERPEARFPKANINLCAADSHQFTPRIIQQEASYSWFFGNGSNDTGRVVDKVFVPVTTIDSIKHESYSLKLISEFPNGCRDSVQYDSIIHIHYLPEAHFWHLPTDTFDNNCYADGRKQVQFFPDSTQYAVSYAWDFGNGKTSDSLSPSIYFKLDKGVIHDSFRVRLITANARGCTDTVNHYVRVLRKPVVEFPKRTIELCDGESHQFSPNTIEQKAHYEWMFSTGFSDTGDVISATFPIINKRDSQQKEFYDLLLIAEFPNGCKDSVYRDSVLAIYYFPSAHFWFTPVDTLDDDCYPNGEKMVLFNSDSSTNATKLKWDFGNGKTTEGANPIQKFNLAKDVIKDSFWVTLITENKQGCGDTVVLDVDVLRSPMASVTPKRVELCDQDTFLFRPVEIENQATYSWQFSHGVSTLGDSVNIPFTIPTKRDSQANEYFHLKMVAEFPTGCKDSIEIDSAVSILYYPQTSFWFTHMDTLPDQCYPNGEKRIVFYSDSSTNSSNLQWHFGNGKTEMGPNPVHTFKLPKGVIDSTYSVTLIAENKLGCSDTAIQTVRVLRKPLVSVTHTTRTRCNGDSLQFAPSQVENKATYYWDFGHGFSDTGDVVTVPFDIPVKRSGRLNEDYPLKFLATYPTGCKDSVVIDSALSILYYPTASFWFTHLDTLDDDCYPKGRKEVVFSSNASTNAFSHNWDFGNGDKSNLQNPTEVFKLPSGNIFDSFLVVLVIGNQLGCSDTIEKYVQVKANPLVQIPSKRIIRCEDDTFSIYPDTIEQSASYLWRFSDGITMKGDTISRTIAFRSKLESLQREFTGVKLISTLSNGCSDSLFTDSLIVNYQLPNARFYFGKIDTLDDECYPKGKKRIFFNSKASTNAIHYEWDFGSNNTDTSINPTHTFQLPTGSYHDSFKVRMIAKNFRNCPDTQYQYVPVMASPTIQFRSKRLHICEKDTFCLQPQVIENGASHTWRFTDAHSIEDSTYICKTAVIRSASKGVGAEFLGVKLRAEFPTGCADSAFTDSLIKVYQLPLGIFQFAKIDTLDDDCYPNGRKRMTFDANTSLNTEDITWYYGDGTVDSGRFANHIYQLDTGINRKRYTVSMVARNAIGCPDSTVNYIDVLRSPEVLFDTINRGKICELIDTCFRPTKWYQGGKHEWTIFSIDSTYRDTGRTVCKAFNLGDTSGTIGKLKFGLKLKVELPNGCSDSLSNEGLFTVFQLPKARFLYTRLDTSPDLCYDYGRLPVDFDSRASKNVSSVRWDFGDGSKSKISNPRYVYQLDTGIIEQKFPITFIPRNALGCPDTAVASLNMKRTPHVLFDTVSRGEICELIDTCFKPSKWYQGASHQWIISSPADTLFGVGRTACTDFDLRDSTGNVGKMKYGIKLRVELPNGCSDSLSSNDLFTVFQLPKARFFYTRLDNSPDLCYDFGRLPVDFDSRASKNVSTMTWDFGDGGNSTLRNPRYAYQLDTGVIQRRFPITFIPRNALGCTDTATRSLNMKRTPHVLFDTLSRGRICELTDTCFKPSRWYQGASHQWIITSPGDTIVEFGRTACTHFNLGDTTGSIDRMKYGVKLKVELPNGCSDSLSSSDLLTVFQLPKASFFYTRLDNSPDLCYDFGRLPVDFDSKASKNVSSVRWDFGDGGSSTLRNPRYVYQLDTGVIQRRFPITFIPRNALGCADTATRSLNMKRTPHVLFDTLSRGRICEALDTCFKPSKWYQGATHRWTIASSNDTIFKNGRTVCTDFDLGDSTGTIGKTRFGLKLQVKLPNGCSDSLAAQNLFTVFQLPKVDFSYTRLDPSPDFCYDEGKLKVEFNSSASENVSSVKWLLGDGTIKTDRNPSHTYKLGEDTVTQRYPVRLVIENQLKCALDLTDEILIKARPYVDFVGENLKLCEEDSAYFEPTDSAVTRHVAKYKWLFKDKTIGYGNGYYRIFDIDTADAFRDVTLVITLNNQCVDSFSRAKYVYIKQKPIAQFYARDLSINPYTRKVYHGKMLFVDSSQYLAPDSNKLQSEWYFGDTTSRQYDVYQVRHTYKWNYNYPVFYALTDTNGCGDTVVKRIRPTFFYGLSVPNALAPETGIGESRLFKPKGIGLESYHLTIRDQTGAVLFETTALDSNGIPTEPWNGTFQGNYVEQGVYLWNIKARFRNGKVWTGNIDEDENSATGTLTVLR